MSSVKYRAGVLVCLITAGCGAPTAGDEAASTPPSGSVRESPALTRTALRSGVPLTARAAAQLAAQGTARAGEFELFFTEPTDHTLPGGAATASFEVGADGRPHYTLNGRPATEAALATFADTTRRELNAQVNTTRVAVEARIDALLRERGLTERVIARSGNAVRLRADRDALEQVTAMLGAHVTVVDVPRPPDAAMTDATNPSGHGALEAVRVRPFAHSYGLRGAGIGVWLEEGNQPKTTDPAIDASHLTILTPEATHSHPTATTSALQQTAPEAMVYYAHDPTGCYLPTEVTQPHNPPIYLGSHSWGYGENTSNYSTCDAAWDDYVYTSRIAMFLAAGNGSNYVMSPGKAYNVNAVGGSDHVNGGMYSGSSYINPETGAMKPDFVAPAVGLYIRAPDTFCPGCDSVTGTSIATPIAAGFAADMLSGSAFFRNQPQALKATMLAGATTNIEGAALYSSRDGAGQINFLHSYFYRSGSWWNGANGAFFDASGYITTTSSMTAGDRMRVAISWLTPGSYVAANNRPSMEMTLEVRRGSFVRTSTLTGETFQLVDFVAPETGSYTIRIRRTFNSGVGNVLLALSVGKVV